MSISEDPIEQLRRERALDVEANTYHQRLGAKWMCEAIVRDIRLAPVKTLGRSETADYYERKWEDASFWRPKTSAVDVCPSPMAVSPVQQGIPIKEDCREGSSGATLGQPQARISASGDKPGETGAISTPATQGIPQSGPGAPAALAEALAPVLERVARLEERGAIGVAPAIRELVEQLGPTLADDEGTINNQPHLKLRDLTHPEEKAMRDAYWSVPKPPAPCATCGNARFVCDASIANHERARKEGRPFAPGCTVQNHANRRACPDCSKPAASPGGKGMSAELRAVYEKKHPTEDDLIEMATSEAERAMLSLPPHCQPTAGGLRHNEDHANACAHRCWAFLCELRRKRSEATNSTLAQAEARLGEPRMVRRMGDFGEEVVPHAVTTRSDACPAELENWREV